MSLCVFFLNMRRAQPCNWRFRLGPVVGLYPPPDMPASRVDTAKLVNWGNVRLSR